MSQDISPEVLQRELVEATQQLTITESTLSRAEGELRNAQAAVESAQAKVSDIQTQYDAARGITAVEEAPLPSRAPTRPTVSQVPTKVDEAPSL